MLEVKNMFIIIGALSVIVGILVLVDSRNLSTIATLFRSYQSVASSFYAIAICLIGAGILLIIGKNGIKINYIKIAGVAYVIGTIAGVVNLGYGDLPIFTLISAGFCVFIGRWLYKKGELKMRKFDDKKKDE
jgi:hypothetical protein